MSGSDSGFRHYVLMAVGGAVDLGMEAIYEFEVEDFR
jgi:hypothetical protein